MPCQQQTGMVIPGSFDRENSYTLGDTLGSGTYGKVKEAIDRYGVRRAVKIIPTGTKSPRAHIQKEIQLHQLLRQHRNVLQLHDVFEDASGVFYLVLDKATTDFCSLLMSRGAFTEHEARAWFIQLLHGINACHNIGVVHGDIKPDNMLLVAGEDRQYRLVVSDLGSAQSTLALAEMASRAREAVTGSRAYAAPEIHTSAHYNAKAADMWAIWVSLYVMLTRTFPFAQG